MIWLYTIHLASIMLHSIQMFSYSDFCIQRFAKRKVRQLHSAASINVQLWANNSVSREWRGILQQACQLPWSCKGNAGISWLSVYKSVCDRILFGENLIGVFYDGIAKLHTLIYNILFPCNHTVLCNIIR